MRRYLALAGALLLLAGCGDPKPSSPTAEDLRRIDVSPTVTITVDDEGFHPTSVDIVVGDVIEVVNEGDGPHSFTADERFDTGRMQPGDTTTLVLTEPGEVPYRDLVVPDHEGTITVTEPGRD